MPPAIVSLSHQATTLAAPWTPRILAELNGQQVKLFRAEGPFIWHQHDQEDELFLVVEGRLSIEFEDGMVELSPGELCVVPRGVRHKPAGEAVILLLEPTGTRNTGEVADSLLTVEELERA